MNRVASDPHRTACASHRGSACSKMTARWSWSECWKPYNHVPMERLSQIKGGHNAQFFFSGKLERNAAASTELKRTTLPWRASGGSDTDSSIDHWMRSGEEGTP